MYVSFGSGSLLVHSRSDRSFDSKDMVMNDFAVERHEQVVDFIACVTRKDDHDSASIHDRELTGIEGFLARAPENEATDAIGQLVRESLQTKPFYLDPAADLA